MCGPIPNSGSPTIGLDFDDTITTNPPMWAELVNIFNRHGCAVYITTFRGADWGNEDLDAFLKTCNIKEVVFTDCKAKKPFCKAKDTHIDIWMDDNPLAVVASLTSQGYTFETKEN